jgi:hypothetical protein
MNAVVIGMDPHKRSATIEVMAAEETVLGGGRYATDIAGYRAMPAFAKRFPQRTWVVEGRAGIGKHIAHRLLADGEQVVDVPPKLSARMRVFATGQGRKTDGDRRALRGPGRHPHDRAATSDQRRTTRDPSHPGRPPPLTR